MKSAAGTPSRLCPTLIGAALLICGGCGGGSSNSSPTSPGNPQPGGRPTNLTASVVSYVEQSVRFGWTRPDQSSTYVIEIGNAPGATSRTVDTQDNGDFEIVPNLAGGENFARVRARSASGLGEPSNEVRFFVVDIRDFVEALLLGTGPYKSQIDSGCGFGTCGVVNGFARGVTVRGRAWSGFAGANLDAIRNVNSQLPSATDGAISASLDLTDDSRPTPAPNEITFGLIPASGGCGGFEACVNVTGTGGVIRTASAIFSAAFGADPLRTASFGHEVGHGVLGMKHVNSDSIGGDQASIMATRPGGTINLPSSLTPLDLEALSFVYRAGLGAGSTLGQMRSAGVIK